MPVELRTFFFEIDLGDIGVFDLYGVGDMDVYDGEIVVFEGDFGVGRNLG